MTRSNPLPLVAAMRRAEPSLKIPRSLALAVAGALAFYVLLWMLGLRTVVAQIFVRRPRPLSEADAAQYGLALGAYHCTAIARLGVCDDGGWTVCLDQLTPKLRSHQYAAAASAATSVAVLTKAGAGVVSNKPANSCLVYSIGVGKIEWQTTFDFSAAAIGCEVFMFDPSIGLPRQDPTAHVHFYPYGLASKNSVLPVSGVKWQMRTLDAIAEELGHADRDIDVLKMDIEEAEWGVLPTLLESPWFTRGRVKQFLIEVHFSSAGALRQLAMLRRLSALGYELINRDENWRYSMPMRGMGDLFDCMELSYVWVGRSAGAAAVAGADDAVAGDVVSAANADETVAAAKLAPLIVERPVWKREQPARRKIKESAVLVE